jgi:hypothetical protein
MFYNKFIVVSEDVFFQLISTKSDFPSVASAIKRNGLPLGVIFQSDNATPYRARRPQYV